MLNQVCKVFLGTRQQLVEDAVTRANCIHSLLTTVNILSMAQGQHQ